jgi:hypothetical protein
MSDRLCQGDPKSARHLLACAVCWGNLLPADFDLELLRSLDFGEPPGRLRERVIEALRAAEDGPARPN